MLSGQGSNVALLLLIGQHYQSLHCYFTDKSLFLNITMKVFLFYTVFHFDLHVCQYEVRFTSACF